MTFSAQTRLDWQEIEEIRCAAERSTLLFITDRCPVGCAHCSVDSRRDSPTIKDRRLFAEIVEWICAQASFEVVGISGGEPFVERWGLTLASRRIVEAGKRLVVYTSGVWATQAQPPKWIADVLDRCATVFLSTDSFHADAMPDARFIHAARAIAAAGGWIVVQVVDQGNMVERTHGLLRQALGAEYQERAEVHPTQLLPSGRGANLPVFLHRQAGQTFPRCSKLGSPMVRYDGVVTGCCNESVIMGLGPTLLRKQGRTGTEVGAAVAALQNDPMLRAIGGVGPGVLTAHPRFGDLAERPFRSICDLCWQELDRVAGDERPDPLVAAINAAVGARR